MLLFALFAALILLADVRLALFAYTLAGSYALYDTLRTHRVRLLLRFIPAAFLVLVLTLSVTLPLLLWRPYLSRAALTPADAGVFPLEWGHLLGLLLPTQGGNIEMLTYLGLPVLVFALIGLLATRRWFWGVAVALAALYALGSNGLLWSLLVEVIPALLWFRVPSRAWFVVTLIAPLLAGFGVQWMIDHRPRRGRLIVLIGTVVAVVAGIFFVTNAPAINGFALLIGGLGAGVPLLIARTNRLGAGASLLILLTLGSAVAGRGWLEWRSDQQWQPPAQAALAAELVRHSAYRVYSPTYSLQQQVTEDYHLRLFGGVAPFQLRGIVAAVREASGVTSEGYSVVQPPLTELIGDDLATANRAAQPDTAVLGQWGVTHLVSAYPLEGENLDPLGEIEGVYLYANLDPALITDFGFPAWARGWGLPDAEIVASLNQWTLAAVLVSSAGMTAVLIAIIVIKVRH